MYGAPGMHIHDTNNIIYMLRLASIITRFEGTLFMRSLVLFSLVAQCMHCEDREERESLLSPIHCQ